MSGTLPGPDTGGMAPHGGPIPDDLRVGLALTPTLVFTLVLSQILRENFGAPSDYDAPHLAPGPGERSEA